jgi:hypothetical protein
MILGPYTSTLDKTLNIDVDGYQDLKQIGFTIPDTADSFLQDMGALNPDVYLSSATVKIEWQLHLNEHNDGIGLYGIDILKVWGTLTFEIIVPDPLNDDDYEEYEHDYEFEAENKDGGAKLSVATPANAVEGWRLVAQLDSLNLRDGIFPTGVEILLYDRKSDQDKDLKKEIRVLFDE